VQRRKSSAILRSPLLPGPPTARAAAIRRPNPERIWAGPPPPLREPRA